MLDGWQIAGFLLNHWADILAFGGFVWVWLTNKNKSEAEKAKEVVFEMAKFATREAAALTIENKEKRQWAINTILEAMPPHVKKHIDPETVGVIVEKVWQQVVKPQLEPAPKP